MDDWSYNPADLATSSKDQVRFHCGDTDETDPLVRDSEITHCLTLQPSVFLAAALICDHLARRYSRQATKSIGSLSIAASDRAKAFRSRAAELRSDAMTGASLAEVFVGGVSISGKQTLNADSDAVQPAFRKGQFDNTGAAGDALAPEWNEEV